MTKQCFLPTEGPDQKTLKWVMQGYDRRYSFTGLIKTDCGLVLYVHIEKDAELV